MEGHGWPDLSAHGRLERVPGRAPPPSSPAPKPASGNSGRLPTGVIEQMPRRLILDSVRQRLHLLRLGGTLLPLLRPDTKLAEQLHIRIRFRVGRGQQLLAVENRVSTRHKTQRLHLLIHLLPPRSEERRVGKECSAR